MSTLSSAYDYITGGYPKDVYGPPPAPVSSVDPTLNVAASLPATSKKKVKKPKKSVKKQAAAPEPDVVTQTQEVQNTESAILNPLIDASKDTLHQADYYRYGNSDPEGDGSGPRTIDEFGDPSNVSEKYQEASIRVVGKLKNSEGKDTDLIAPYSKFILEGVQASEAERSQVVETFGDYYAFFFGKRPPVYTYTGTLINAKNISWFQEFEYYYENYLRGTKCVESQSRIIMTYNGHQIEGYILGTSNTLSGANDKGVPFSFQVLITDKRLLQMGVDFGKAEQNSSFNNSGKFINLLTGHGLSSPPISDAYNTVKDVVSNKTNPASATTPVSGDVSKLTSSFGLPALTFPPNVGQLVTTATGKAGIKLPFGIG